jgi:hypothetical protein
MQPLRTTLILTAAALALSACGSNEIKTGSLVQRFAMVDSEGRHFGVVELDPINGGSVVDVSGRVVGKIVPPAAAPINVASTPFAPAPLPGGAPVY